VKIELNHTIVPAHDKEKSARFYERFLDSSTRGLWDISPRFASRISR